MGPEAGVEAKPTRISEQGAMQPLPYLMGDLVGEADLVFITLDTLRYDVAQAAWKAGELKTLENYLGAQGWECRHTPASFTYAAHHAFFAGFLPTPTHAGPHPRLYASRFGGSVTATSETFVFDEPTLPEALSVRGYQTICIGGTGFFNKKSRLGEVLPNLFDESHWSPQLGVADRQSELNQLRVARECVEAAGNQRTFTFINVAAMHQPNWFYGSSEPQDTLQTHRAALIAVDQALHSFLAFCRERSKTFCIVCSDHGTAYGEQGYTGHRLAHEVVWNVPYAEFIL